MGSCSSSPLVLARTGEAGGNDLRSQLNVEQGHLSQHLVALQGRNTVEGRKVGNNVCYSVRDPENLRLLDVPKKIFNNHRIDVRDVLTQLRTVRTSFSSMRYALATNN